jgi:DNA-binding transcriptional LysR family regulator
MPLSDLAAESFVCYPRDAGTSLYGQMISLCRAAGFNPRIGQEAREISTIVGLVAAGLGVALLPASLQRIQVDGVVFRRLSDPGAVTTMWLTWRQTRPRRRRGPSSTRPPGSRRRPRPGRFMVAAARCSRRPSPAGHN